MTGSLVTRFAVRSLGRNVRRTFLSVLGIGIGCAVAVYVSAFMRGSAEMRVRSIAESGFGHLRIAPRAWEETRNDDLRLSDWRREMESVREVDGVRAAAPHARTTALLAFGTRVSGVQMLGVDPVEEQKINRLVGAVDEGRYLEPGDRKAAVIGRAIADRLDAGLEDGLLVTLVDRTGEMQYAMLRIVGIVSTGSRDIDAAVCHVTLEDLEELTGREGAGEITISLENPLRIGQTAERLRAQIPDEDAVLTWREVVPSQGGDEAGDRAFSNLLVGIVVVVVILGVTSAQLTAILERRRELAVLMALGMRGPQLVRLLLLEALALGLLGAVIGLVIITPFIYYNSVNGIDFASLFGGDFSLEGVVFEPVLYPHLGLWMVPHALGVALLATLAAAVYPAWFALRTNPMSAMSLR